MRSTPFFRAAVLGTALTLSACAASRPRGETVASRRLQDSAPEKSAALRAATPGLELEAEDQRWGIEAAKELKRDRPPKTLAPLGPEAGAKSVDVKLPTQP
jgi:hypothetical protein